MSNFNEKLSNDDRVIMRRRAKKRAKREGPQIGDIVRMPDGQEARIAYLWPSSFQPTPGIFHGSFHLTRSGGGSHSGALQPSISYDRLIDTTKTREAEFWFFSGGTWRAHNGVKCMVPVKVWKVSERR